jgi:hypothetical protein
MIQMMREIRVSSVESANCSRCGHSESLIGLAKTQAPEGALTFNNDRVGAVVVPGKAQDLVKVVSLPSPATQHGATTGPTRRALPQKAGRCAILTSERSFFYCYKLPFGVRRDRY